MAIKCIHCLKITKDVTEDHILPVSWYLTSTPKDIEKWTAPACRECNNRLGALENELRIRMALCVDPTDPELAEIAKSAIRALKPQYAKNEKDRKIRQKMRNKILKDLQYFDPQHPSVMPGFGPHPGQENQKQVRGVTISSAMVKEFGTKVLKGIYYKLEGKYLNDALELSINITRDEQSKVYDDLVKNHGVELFRGPGLHIFKAVPIDDEEAFVSIITIWKRFRLRGTIIRKL